MISTIPAECQVAAVATSLVAYPGRQQQSLGAQGRKQRTLEGLGVREIKVQGGEIKDYKTACYREHSWFCGRD